MATLSEILDPKLETTLDDFEVPLDDKRSYVKEEVSILDKTWFDVRYIPPSGSMNSIVAKNRYYSTAKQKFTSTKLGESLPLNPKPQFSPTADVPIPNRINGQPYKLFGEENSGLGRVYSEVYDDWQQLLYLNFGKPRFNSLSDFFLSAIDYRDSYIANTGRTPTGYSLGKLLGAGVMLAAFPLMTLTIWGLNFASKLALGSNTFDYYYLEPTMHLFWGGASQLITVAATELGIVIPELMPDGTEADKIGVPAKINLKDMEEMKELMPGLFSDNNYIDIYKIAAGPQAMANKALLKEKELYERGDINEYDFLGYVYEDGQIKESTSAGATDLDTNNRNLSFTNFVNKLTKGNGLFADDGKSEDSTPTKIDSKPEKYTKDNNGMYKKELSEEKQSYIEKYAAAVDSGIKDGGMYAILAVEKIANVTESFNNTFSSIDTGDKINSVAGTARNAKFSIAGGNIVGETVKDVLGAAKNMAVGALDSISFGLSGVLQTLTGDAYVNIAQKWENSSVSMPELQYTVKLRRTYNTPYSILVDELIPFCILLNAIAPAAAGKASKASPYLCEAYCKGFQHIKLGMFKSMSVTRATGNLPFTKGKQTIGMDITFTIADLNPEITVPVASSVFDAFNVALEDDTALNRYLATIASRSLLTNKYMVPKIKLRASRLLMAKDKALSPHAMGLRTGGFLSGILGGAVADHALALNENNKI